MKTKTAIIKMCIIGISVICSLHSNGQVTHLNNGAVGALSTDFLGWDGTVTWDLRIENQAVGYGIKLYTDGNATERMELDANGDAGIGIAPYTGLRLTVSNDINLATNVFGHGYHIGHTLLLSAPGTQNLYLGFGSGAAGSSTINNTFIGDHAGASTTYSSNTFVGNHVGFTNYSGSENTMVGDQAGYTQANGDGNSYVGFKAGYTANNRDYNTMMGFQAGRLNNFDYNSFYGAFAGENNSGGGSNCFFGYRAGISNTSSSFNSYFGMEAGRNLTGTKNTVVGAETVVSNTPSGEQNTIVGAFSMYNMSGGNYNTTVGSRTGYNFDTGDENTFVGFQAGQNNSGGNLNTFLGKDAGISNNSGVNNTFVGSISGGSNVTGDNNSFLGYGSGTTVAGLHNASALGANAIVMNNNHMILGDNSVFVGIGLTSDATGPRSKLEINAGASNPNVSGLQFTQLTSASPAGGTATKFLTVDGTGKVILMNDLGSGGYVAACTSSTPALTLDYIPKWSSVGATKELCMSQIYDNGTYVGINATPSSGAKFQVNGDIGMTNLSNALYFGGYRFLASEGSGYQYNVYLGIEAGPSSTPHANTGYNNIVVGRRAGYSLAANESNNIFIGGEAGFSTDGTIGGGNANVFIGDYAGRQNTTGTENVFIGEQAGYSTTFDVGGLNVAIGAYAGANSAGDANVLIGGGTDLDASGAAIIGSCAIGYGAQAKFDQSVALGCGANTYSPNVIVMGTFSEATLMGYGAVPGSVTVGGVPSGTNYRLYVNYMNSDYHTAFFNGATYAVGNYVTSDANLKTEITNINELTADSILESISPKTYFFDTLNNPSLGLPRGLQYGVLAQDVERVLPGLVDEVTAPPVLDSLGQVIYAEKTFKAVNYAGLIPLLMKSNQNQKNRIDSLINLNQMTNDRLDQLEQLINNCCSNSGAGERIRNGINVQLSSENTIILNQNDPNPFAEQTRITYNVTEDVKEAKIIFFDNKGHVLQTVTINERGAGQINVYGEKLSSGIYSYSLIADGKVIDTKKMVCTK